MRRVPRALDRDLAIALALSPIAWVVHLLGGYVTVALWCASAWRGAGGAIAALTVLCGAAAVGGGVLGVRVWRRGQEFLREDEEAGTPEPWDGRMGERGARTAFLGMMAIFMAAIFALLIMLQGLPPLFTQACPPSEGP